MRLAGEKVRASDLITAPLEAVHNTTVTVTTTVTDVAGASLTISTAEAGVTVLVIGVFDVQSTGTADVFTGYLAVDGANNGSIAVSSAQARLTVSQVWVITLASAGEHTLKLRAGKTSNTNTVTLRQSHTKIALLGMGVS